MSCIFLTDAEKKEYFIRLLESLNRNSYSTMNVTLAWSQLKQVEKYLQGE